MADLNKGSYKKPHSINAVSIGMLLLLAGVVYWAYCFGPAYLSHLRVNMICKETAHRYYKLRTLETSLKAQESNKLVTEARGEIIKTLGFEDPELTVQLLLDEDKKLVLVVADYHYTVTLIGLDKQRILHFRSEGDSDYENTGL